MGKIGMKVWVKFCLKEKLSKLINEYLFRFILNSLIYYSTNGIAMLLIFNFLKIVFYIKKSFIRDNKKYILKKRFIKK